MYKILQETSFKTRKDRTLPVYDKYMSFNPKKANEILDCGRSLWFLLKEHTKTKEQKLFLENMYTCKDRFCPFCNWRRQMKYSKLIYAYLSKLQQKKKLRYIFLTLTVKNSKFTDLRASIQHINKSFKRLKETRRWKSSILGYLRVLEVTIEKKRRGYVHPHFHVLLTVEPKYFDTKKNLYIKQLEFAKMWKQALRVEYTPSVDVRIIKQNKDKNAIVAAVSEMCKYPLKDTDISCLNAKQFEELTIQLKNIRNINAGGILKEVLKKSVKIDDDLVHIDDDEKDELWIVLKKLLYTYENLDGKLDYFLKEVK
jgi:plasmid rolling circle replication initiator protein Rep